MQESIAFFGTYSVDETDKAIAFHIEGGTYQNWRGADQKRLFKLSGDKLTWTVPTPSIGFLNRLRGLKARQVGEASRGGSDSTNEEIGANPLADDHIVSVSLSVG